jgi:hypothetical protein
MCDTRLSLTSASHELIRRYFLRWQDERLLPTFRVSEDTFPGFSLNVRILLANLFLRLQSREFRRGVLHASGPSEGSCVRRHVGASEFANSIGPFLRQCHLR